MKQIFIFITLILVIYSQNDNITGSWEGELSVSGTALRIIFHINEKNNTLSSTMDSPDQGANGIPVEKTIFTGNKLLLELPRLSAKYNGYFQKDSIVGNWSQGSFSLKLVLKKEVTKVNRPQVPKKPYSYNEEEVTFKNNDIIFSGTLTKPTGNGKFHSVILISGSGQQDRNSSLFGHKPFLVISDFLTRNGYTVLRFDDRGIGKSTGTAVGATSKDFSNDVIAGITFLNSRDDILSVGLIGHSEGAMIAQMIASKMHDLSFIILLAGPGINGFDLILEQNYNIMNKMGLTRFKIEEEMTKKKTLFELIRSNKYDKSALKNFDINEKDFNKLNTKWFRFFLNYKPENYLPKVKSAIFALNGENDCQVISSSNLNAIKKILEESDHKSYKVTELKKLNHLFQTSETGLPNEYAKIEETFAPEALKIILEWMNKYHRN